jgi:hypothetical protein
LKIPGVLLEVGVTVRVLVPEPLGIVFVLSVAVASEGGGALKLTLPAKPFVGATVTVKLAGVPRATAYEAGVTESVKFGVVASKSSAVFQKIGL